MNNHTITYGPPALACSNALVTGSTDLNKFVWRKTNQIIQIVLCCVIKIAQVLQLNNRWIVSVINMSEWNKIRHHIPYPDLYDELVNKHKMDEEQDLN